MIAEIASPQMWFAQMGLARERRWMGSPLSDKLTIALAATSSGIYLWNVETNLVSFDAHVAELFGLSTTKTAGLPLEAFLERIHPEDQPKAARTFYDAIQTGDSYQANYKLLRTDGTIAQVIVLGHCFRNENGSPSECTGIIFNMTMDESSLVSDALLDVCRLAYVYAEEAREPVVTSMLARVLSHLKGSDVREQKIGRTSH